MYCKTPLWWLTTLASNMSTRSHLAGARISGPPLQVWIQFYYAVKWACRRALWRMNGCSRTPVRLLHHHTFPQKHRAVVVSSILLVRLLFGNVSIAPSFSTNGVTALYCTVPTPCMHAWLWYTQETCTGVFLFLGVLLFFRTRACRDIRMVEFNVTFICSNQHAFQHQT